MIRTIFIVIYLVIYVLYSVPLRAVLWLISKADSHKAQLLMLRSVQGACKVVIFLGGIKLTVTGYEKVPRDRACLFIGNHKSYFDIIVTFIQAENLMGYLAKAEVSKIPLFAGILKSVNCIFLDRKDIRAGLTSILDSIEKIKSGVSMFVFPEGTRCPDDELHDFKGGSFKIATKSGCPVIPVAISGTADIFEKHIPFVKSTAVTITYGDPIFTDSMSSEEKKLLPEQTKAAIESALKK